jgi:MSHA biogenesis protein MshP
MNFRLRSAGMALVSAIFLILVLSALALAMVALSNAEQDTGTKSLLSAKVYYGAKAGLDWGIQRAVAPAAPICNPTTPFTFTALQAPALNGVSVTVTCVRTTHGAGNFVYYIQSTATIGALGNVNYAERHLEATVSNIP